METPMTMTDFYDFTLHHGFNDDETVIVCRMAYTIRAGRPQTMTQPEEPPTLDVVWVKAIKPMMRPGLLGPFADRLYDHYAADIEDAALAAHLKPED